VNFRARLQPIAVQGGPESFGAGNASIPVVAVPDKSSVRHHLRRPEFSPD